MSGGPSAIAVDGSTAFIGGGGAIGGRLGGGAAFDSSSSGLVLAPSITGGGASASLPDGSGGWYLGGSFDHVEGSVRYGLAHILANGSVDPSFPQVGHEPLSVVNSNEFVQALALSSDGKTLYVGGEFDMLGSQSRDNLGAITLATDAVTSWNPNPDSFVGALAAGFGSAAGSVYAAGTFSSIGANHISSPNVAKLSESNGNADASFSATTMESGSASSAETNTLALGSGGNFLYIGGFFDHVGATARNSLARVSTSDGTVNAWNPNVDETVNVVRVVPGGGTVYAAGFFSHVLGVARSGLAAIDSSTSTASVDAWNPAPNSTVEALDFDGSNVVAAGFFSQIGGQNRPGLAEVSETTGNATAFAPNVASSGISALAVGAGRVFAGGTNLVTNPAVRSGLAALDVGGQPTAFAPQLTGVERDADAFALSPDGRTLYAGGGFQTVNGQTRDGLAAFDAATGALLPWNPGTNGSVQALAISPDGGTLYVGGFFSLLGSNSQTRNALGAVSTADGSATAWNPSLASGTQVRALALAPGAGTLYVGGSFTTAGHNGASRHNLAAISTAAPGDATSWAPVLAGVPTPQAMALSVAGDGTVYLGGEFKTVNGTARQSVVAISPAGAGAATGWNANITDSDSLNQPFADALALSPDGSTVVAGGRFDGAGGQQRIDVAELTTASGAVTGWNPDLGPFLNGVKSLSYVGPTLRMGGGFNRVGAAAVQGYAQFTSPPGDGHASIGGTVRYARTLTCSESFSNSPTAVGFQWNRSGVAIAGATGSTHKVTAGDTGHALTCAAVALNAGGSGAAISAAVTPPPEITSFKISTHHVKRHLLAGKAAAAKRHKKKKKPKGARFTFSLTEKATATIKIERRGRGVKVGKKCKAPTRKLTRGKHRKPCTLYKTIGSLKVKAKSGKTTVKLPKKVGHAHLTNGRYRGEISAKDSGRRKSNTKRVTFSVSR